MTMVHRCARPGCGTLTMGVLCLEHEQRRDDPGPSARARLLLRRLPAGMALVGAAAAGALVRAHLSR